MSVEGTSLEVDEEKVVMLANSILISVGSAILIALIYGVFIMGIVNAIYPLPGHEKGGIWPIYVKEHYSTQTSQNLLDPYSFTHATHGVIGYILASWIHIDLAGGLVFSLMSAMLWEMLENTNLVITLFRENSGTSENYRGDSRINVVGDILSCGVGYMLAHVGHQIGGPWFPFAWLVASEIALAASIRDNMLLMGLQLIAPIPIIAEWQAEVIPLEYRVKKKDDSRSFVPKLSTFSDKYLIIKKDVNATIDANSFELKPNSLLELNGLSF